MAGPIVSYVRNPYPTFPGGVHYFHGCLYPGLGIADVWTCSDRRFHINVLELKAVILALHHCLGCSITGPSYFDRYRQYHCGLHQQTGRDLFPRPVAAGSRSVLWLQTWDITLRARHIPGCLSVIADRLSWPKQPITTEWSLHPKVMNLIFRLWGTPVVDMFATVHNTHLPQFLSPVP